MPITASCGNCGKTYQAPDRLAGKTVRCKQCGEMFRIDAADGTAGEPDLDALERSFADESLATGGATAMGGTIGGTVGGTQAGTVAGGPKVDAHGRARIERGEGIDGMSVRGEAGANLLRSNFRYRYPGAKQIDQFLPWVLVALSGYVVGSACLTRSASGEEPPTTGVGVSRFAILVAAYLFVVWPASHVALTMATTRLRMSMPRAAVWRSFAAFTPVLLLGGGLYVFSGGDAVALLLGVLVGATVAVGSVALLFRMFPNEVPTAAGYVAAGSVGGALFAAAAIFAVNLVGSSLARWDKAPTLFVSPIAVGLPWVDKPPAAHATVAKRPTTSPAPQKSNDVATTAPPIDVPPPPMGALPTLPVPRPDGDDVAALVKRVEVVPVRPGFDEVITTPVASNAIGVIRGAGGGTLEMWDRSTWKQPIPNAGRVFDRLPGSLAMNTIARMAWQFVHSPSDRLEQVEIGNAMTKLPIDVDGGGSRSLLGFVGENELLMRVNENGGLTLERYDVVAGKQKGERQTFASGNGSPMQVEPYAGNVRMLPDGSGVLAAGRDAADNRPTLALYDGAHYQSPDVVRRVKWNDPTGFRPLGLAVNPGGKVALLLNAGGTAYLTVWEMRPTHANGLTIKASETAVVDRRVGLLSDLTPPDWSPDVDPLLWIDDETLLLYGNLVINARAQTGVRIGTLGLTGTTGQFLGAGEGVVLLVQRQNSLNTLLQVTLDPATLAARRK